MEQHLHNDICDIVKSYVNVSDEVKALHAHIIVKAKIKSMIRKIFFVRLLHVLRNL